jgi:chemotaxis protein MotB
MFASGSAELTSPSQELLTVLSQVFQRSVETVIVEGHTDNRPVRTVAFPSNWELSAARASAVVRHLSSLKHALPPSQYIAVGYGEFRPVATNSTREGRNRNRRVEILFNWHQWNPALSQPTSPRP